MKTATLTQTHSHEDGSIWTVCAAMVQAVAQASARRRARRIASQGLRVLSDTTLKDIGMHRSEISSIVHGTPNERKRSNESA